jgi:hypothetical protein
MSEFLLAGNNTSEQAREWAAQERLVVMAPTEYELYIDIDSDADLTEWDRNYEIVDKLFGIDEFIIKPSRNKTQGKHIYVKLAEKVTPLERCLCQAILGSDRRREGHSLGRIRRGDPDPTLFFEKSESSMSGVSPSPSTSGESAESSATPSGETLSLE